MWYRSSFLAECIVTGTTYPDVLEESLITILEEGPNVTLQHDSLTLLKTESFQTYLHRKLDHLATLFPWPYHHSSSKRCHLHATTAHHSVRTFWEDTAWYCCCSYTYTSHVYEWADWIWIQIYVPGYSQSPQWKSVNCTVYITKTWSYNLPKYAVPLSLLCCL